MNIQNMMKQAQQLQREMTNIKEEINNTVFPGKSSMVEVSVNGKKEVLKVQIDKDMDLTKDDMEMLEDMIVVAMNDAFKKVDEMTDQKMSKFGPGVSGLL